MELPKQMTEIKEYINDGYIVKLIRGKSVESIHRANAVVCDNKGRVLMKSGNHIQETFIRSALKPFQALPFLSSGTAENINCGEEGIAIACGSHSGDVNQARQAFQIMWKADVDINYLKCPIPLRGNSPLQHNCSGKHAAFLATCKKLKWPLENYLHSKHPIQIEIFRRVAEFLKIPAEELVAEFDDCGAPTLRLQLSQMALLYAHLANSETPELEQISRAMINHPYLVGGKNRFDTELMKRSHGQLVSKSGAEGIQCISRLGKGIGVAIKVEDGSKRAKQAVALKLLSQLDWITPTSLQELEEKVLNLNDGLRLEVSGQLKFQET